MIRPVELEVPYDFVPSAILSAQVTDWRFAGRYPLIESPLGSRIGHVFVKPVIECLCTVPGLESIGVAEIAEGVLIRSAWRLLEVALAITIDRKLNAR